MQVFFPMEILTKIRFWIKRETRTAVRVSPKTKSFSFFAPYLSISFPFSASRTVWLPPAQMSRTLELNSALQ